MNIKHVAVTNKQWQKTWNDLPPEVRNNDERSLRGKEFNCYRIGRLLIWQDYLLPESQWNEEVESALLAVRHAILGEDYEHESTEGERLNRKEKP